MSTIIKTLTGRMITLICSSGTKKEKDFILDNHIVDIKVNTEMQYFDLYWSKKVETDQTKIRKAMQTYINEKYEGLELIEENLSPDDSHVVRYLSVA